MLNDAVPIMALIVLMLIVLSFISWKMMEDPFYLVRILTFKKDKGIIILFVIIFILLIVLLVYPIKY